MESVARSPTAITLWMLNRLINGTETPGERRPLIACLRQSRARIKEGSELSETLENFLEHIADTYRGE